MFSASTKRSAAKAKAAAKETYYNARRDAEDHNYDDEAEGFFDRARSAQRQAAHYLHDINDQVRNSAESMNKEIQSHPLRSTVAALGIGYLIGKIFG